MARQRQNALEAELEAGRPTRAGDLFVLEACSEQPVEWAVLAEDPEDSARIQVVAVDSSTLVGSADIAARAEQRGPVSVRCGTTAWLAEKTLQASRSTGRLPEEALAQARRKVRLLAAGETVGNAWERQLDTDPEYRLWQEEVLAPAWAALPKLGPRLRLSEPTATRREEPVPGRQAAAPHRRRWRQPLALAATVFLVLFLGLGREVFRTRQEAERQAETHRQQLGKLEGAQREGAEAHRREMTQLREEHRRAVADLGRQLAVGSGSQPQAEPPPVPLVNLPFVVLASTRLRGEDREVRLDLKADYLLVIFQVENPQPEALYRLQLISEEDGREVWSHHEMTLTGRSEISVALPGNLLTATGYRFYLALKEGGDWQQVDEYRLRVRLHGR